MTRTFVVEGTFSEASPRAPENDISVCLFPFRVFGEKDQSIPLPPVGLACVIFW